MPQVAERLRLVREYRNGQRPAKDRAGDERRPPGISAKALANSPAEFHVTVIPNAPFLVIPEVSSERRDYVPIGWLEPPVIPSNLVRILPNADRYHFGILTSRMHMAWLRYIGGRLKSDFRYSIGIVYNAFPWPEADESAKAKIRALAEAVLDARARFPDASLADLYDADAMKPELRAAHRNLDKAVDALYKRNGFASDRERVEHLSTLYEKLVSPLMAASGKAHRRFKRPRSRKTAERPVEPSA